MREHEYRGKEKKTGKWIEGQRCTNGREVWIVYDEDFCKSTSCGEDVLMAWRFEEVIPETVGKYIDLKDKNDTMIYEGDIVKNGNGGLFIIGPLEQGSFSAIGTKGKQKDTVYHISALCSNTEVVGNIHDNPELLEADNASH